MCREGMRAFVHPDKHVHRYVKFPLKFYSLKKFVNIQGFSAEISNILTHQN